MKNSPCLKLSPQPGSKLPLRSDFNSSFGLKTFAAGATRRRDVGVGRHSSQWLHIGFRCRGTSEQEKFRAAGGEDQRICIDGCLRCRVADVGGGKWLCWFFHTMQRSVMNCHHIGLGENSVWKVSTANQQECMFFTGWVALWEGVVAVKLQKEARDCNFD